MKIRVRNAKVRILLKLIITLVVVILLNGCSQLVNIPLDSSDGSMKVIGLVDPSYRSALLMDMQMLKEAGLDFAMVDAFSSSYALYPSQIIKTASTVDMPNIFSTALNNSVGIIPIMKTFSLRPSVIGNENLARAFEDGTKIDALDPFNDDAVNIICNLIDEIRDFNPAAIAFTTDLFVPTSEVYSDKAKEDYFTKFNSTINPQSEEFYNWYKAQIIEDLEKILSTISEVPAILILDNIDEAEEYKDFLQYFDFVGVRLGYKEVTLENLAKLTELIGNGKLIVMLDKVGLTTEQLNVLKEILKNYVKFIGIYDFSGESMYISGLK